MAKKRKYIKLKHSWTKAFKSGIFKSKFLLYALVFGLIGGIATWQSFAATNYPMSFTASPQTLTAPGGNVTFSWHIQVGNEDQWQCWVGDTSNIFDSTTYRSPRSVTKKVSKSTTFNIKCSNNNDEQLARANLTVTVNPPPPPPPPAVPTVHLSASPTSVRSGGSSTLSWSTTSSSSCNASGGWSGAKPTLGSASTGALNRKISFTLSCSGPGGTAAASTLITVTASAPVTPPSPAPPPPSISQNTTPTTSVTPTPTDTTPTTTDISSIPNWPVTINFKDAQNNPFSTQFSLGGKQYSTDKNGAFSLELAAGDYTASLKYKNQNHDFKFKVSTQDQPSDGSQPKTQSFNFVVPTGGHSLRVWPIVVAVISMLACVFFLTRWLLSRGEGQDPNPVLTKSAGEFPLPILAQPQPQLQPQALPQPQAGAVATGPSPHSVRYPWTAQTEEEADKEPNPFTTRSIARDENYVEPEDMFEAGQKRLESEGLSPKPPETKQDKDST